MNTNGHVKQALSGREAAALAALIGVGGGTAAGVAGGTAGLAAGGLAGLGGGYAAGRIRKKLRRNAENRQRDYYSSAQTKQAFDKKMMLCLAATGRDVEKIAEAYEAELEKIAGPLTWLAERAGGLGMKAYSALPAKGAISGAAGRGWESVFGAPGESMLKKHTAPLREAFERGAQRASQPKITMPGAPASGASKTVAQAGDIGAPGAAAAPKPAAVRMADAGHAQVTVPGALPGPQVQGSVPAAGAMVQGGAQPVAAPVDDIFSQMANYGNQGLTAGRDFLNEQLGLQIGYPAGALGGRGLGDWFAALDPAQKAKVLAPLAVGGIGATGLAAGTAGLGAGLIGGGLAGTALS